jgi:hypothetical protein
VIKQNNGETLLCDSCGLVIQPSEQYVEWFLKLGVLVLHIPCTSHTASKMYNHVKHYTQPDFNQHITQRRRPSNEHTPQFVTKEK